MIKKYNFESSANKAIMAEILTHRDRQPRAAFLSSLAAVMVAAISLTMVFGSLSTGALPLGEQEQKTNVSSVSDGDTLPPEEVIRVHTETKTETVTVYNDTPQLSETLLVSDTVGEELPSEGKAIFDQEKQLFQWQYNGETFTFFVNDNTVYRRNETTGKTDVVFKGDSDVALYCVTDRYLFFRANQNALDGGNTYCYRADLITKEILRLFNYRPSSLSSIYREREVEFVRIDGNDVIFTHYIVHEDGSYEEIPDTKENYPDSDKNKYLDLSCDISHGYLKLQLNDDNTITGKDENGNYYDLGINIENLKRFGYAFDDFCTDVGWICRDKEGFEYIYITFDTIQNDDTINDSYKSLLLYYGKLTDSGVDGAVIYATALNSRDMFFTGKGEFFSKELLVTYGCYDIKNEFDLRELYIPVNFDKLTAPTKSEPEYYPLENGKNLTVTYYPCKSTHAATPDSAE